MAKKKKNKGSQGIADSGIRKPIVTIMGHVDHGKTQTLDTIRQSTVVDREAGAITQSIGASIVPFETINRICGALLKKVNMELNLPGLLFIDTPGHAAFTNLRKRGGNLADIAILVVDINEGLKPQTIEAIEILKTYKTPFVIALNKMDLISGWRTSNGTLIENIESQSQQTQLLLEQKLYEIVGKLAEFGFESDRFDRVGDYTKQIALIPTCAKSGEGIPELLMILTGLAQKFLNEKLELHDESSAKGTILEVKEEQGLGTTIDVILYDGTINVNDTIVIGNMGQPIVTKVKALVEPAPLAEMADKKSKFRPTKSATAACGIKIAAPELDNVIAGMPLMVADKDNIETIKEEIQKDIEEVLVETDEDGIVIKADSLGSLEAMRTLLKEHDITIRKALVGDISKRDLIDAKACLEKNPLHGIILGFNSKIPADVAPLAEDAGITILTNRVIYRLLEDYESWKKALEKKMNEKALDKIVRPFKCLLMPNHVFRQSGPAVVGLEVIAGTMVPNVGLLKSDGAKAGFLKGIQMDKKNVEKAEKDKQVAGSIEGITVGRQVDEGDTLYLDMAPDDFRKLKDLKKLLEPEEIEILKEIAEIKRKNEPMWGV